MIDIKRDALVLRYIKWFDFAPVHSLCQLARQVMLATFLYIVFAVLILLVAFITIVSPIMMWFDPRFEDFGVVGLALWTVVVSYTLAHLVLKGISRLRHERRVCLSHVEPSLFSQWVQAKKQKICPRVRVID